MNLFRSLPLSMFFLIIVAKGSVGHLSMSYCDAMIRSLHLHLHHRKFAFWHYDPPSHFSRPMVSRSQMKSNVRNFRRRYDWSILLDPLFPLFWKMILFVWSGVERRYGKMCAWVYLMISNPIVFFWTDKLSSDNLVQVYANAEDPTTPLQIRGTTSKLFTRIR